MFKATGNIKSKRLQEHVDILGAKFKISVVTGPSGSYREEDILRLLAKWCEPWSGTRKWEFILLDAYAPGLTNNVQRLCWNRGYIVVTHGGRASMITQTNDTGLHKDVRANFIDLQAGAPVHANWHGTWYPGHVLEVRDDDVIDRIPQLGDTHPNGGTTAHQKNRFDILDSIRSVARLTSPPVQV